MRLDFACGHALTAEDGKDLEPVCPECQCRQVSQVKVRPPKFTGWCTGPHAEYDPNTQPARVNLAPAGPLPLKDHDHVTACLE